MEKDILSTLSQEEQEAIWGIIAKAPIHLQDDVKKVYEYFADNQLDACIEGCEKLLASSESLPEVEMLLVQNLYYRRSGDDLDRALSILQSLQKRFPENDDLYPFFDRINQAIAERRRATEMLAAQRDGNATNNSSKISAGSAASGGTYRRETKKIGRNDPCPCGSGKKYKKCCGR